MPIAPSTTATCSKCCARSLTGVCTCAPPARRSIDGLRDYSVEGQIGLEETPEQWVDRLVAVFREVRRVLRDDGTLWVEVGDSYSAGGLGPGQQGTKQGTNIGSLLSDRKTPPPGYKPKDLLGQPWLLAFALRADGWCLRSEIIWHKTNPMPESVTDRPTKSHSTVFLLSKNPRYYFDADAIREAYAGEFLSSGVKNPRYGRPGGQMPSQIRSDVRVNEYRQNDRTQGGDPSRIAYPGAPQIETIDGSPGEAPRGPDGRRQTRVTGRENSGQHRDGERWPNPAGANARSVWTIPTQPTPWAHFATWPEALVRRMILAGSSERGVCGVCGAPWVRDVEASYDTEGRTTNGPRSIERCHESPGRNVRMVKSTETLGWSPLCGHGADAAVVPATVLDVFAGSGTTAVVARKLGRRSVGIELNQEYLDIAAGRLAQQSLFAFEPHSLRGAR